MGTIHVSAPEMTFHIEEIHLVRWFIAHDQLLALS